MNENLSQAFGLHQLEQILDNTNAEMIEDHSIVKAGTSGECNDSGDCQAPGICRVCGCTDDDCSQCIERTGHPCYWVKGDLCSACEDLA